MKKKHDFWQIVIGGLFEGALTLWAAILTVCTDQWNVFHGERAPRAKIG